jgi:GNAT superfamily N-acetyltransferase
MRWISEPLGAEHELEAFHSGNEALGNWLKRSARQAQAMRTARTFVWHEGDGVVVGYFSLAAHLVLRADVPKRVGRGSPASIPAILLARLALARARHGQGLGGELLWDALSRAVAASNVAAGRVVVVDAIDEAAASFYEHHGFSRVPKNPHRLIQKVSDIAAALQVPVAGSR